MRAICHLQLKDRKRYTDLMYMQGFNDIIDQLAMANSVCWYCHLLRRQDSHVLGRALDFVVEAQRNEGKLKRTWKKQVEEESI